MVGESGEDLPAGVRVVAATWEGQMTVMVVNDVDEAHSLTIRVPGAGKKTLTSYRYFDRERPVDRDGYPVAARRGKKVDLERGVTVDLPSRGVLFLTTAPLVEWRK